MPNITLKLELLKPTIEKQKMYEQMTKTNTDFANWLLDSPLLKGATSKTFGDFSTDKFMSSVVNQTIRDVKSQKKEQKAKLFKRMWCSYNNQNMKYEKQGNLYTASFPTPEKRIGVPIVVKRFQRKWLELLMDGHVKLGASKLLKKRGRWYLHTSLEYLIHTAQPEFTKTKIMGVDLGLRYLATVAIGTNTKFFRGNELAFIRRKFAEYRRTLGRSKKLDAIRKSKGRESRWMKELNHKISRQIVNEAIRNGVSIIRLEDLSGIRKANKHKRPHLTLHNWSFYQLRQFIQYKAELVGIEFQLVNPKYTSQTCKCGHRSKSNRNRLVFKCNKCGYKAHADTNASINIANAISGLSKKSA